MRKSTAQLWGDGTEVGRRLLNFRTRREASDKDEGKFLHPLSAIAQRAELPQTLAGDSISISIKSMWVTGESTKDSLGFGLGAKVAAIAIAVDTSR